jgi:hypothetical protein
VLFGPFGFVIDPVQTAGAALLVLVVAWRARGGRQTQVGRRRYRRVVPLWAVRSDDEQRDAPARRIATAKETRPPARRRESAAGPGGSACSPRFATAAASFADPRFQQQWQQGEALAPNFWGPLANAHDGQQEAYTDAADGQRLVQYFDKGRMELTNGALTNGLLAVELVTGKMQLGDNTFMIRFAPEIPIAGDPDGGAPTYTDLSTTAAAALATTPMRTGMVLSGSVLNGKYTETPPTRSAGEVPALVLTAYDTATEHNVMSAFAAYRSRVGLSTVGLAISEPFLTTYTVAGVKTQGVVQLFERRVLTYVAANPVAFRVEMGNIGLTCVDCAWSRRALLK